MAMNDLHVVTLIKYPFSNTSISLHWYLDIIKN